MEGLVLEGRRKKGQKTIVDVTEGNEATKSNDLQSLAALVQLP